MTTVLLDCDSVLADFDGAVRDDIMRNTGYMFTREQITDFDIGKSLGISFADWTSGIKSGWCSALKTLPGAVEGVEQLKRIADVHIVTSPWERCDTWQSERTRWIAEHLGIKYDHVHHTHAKHLMRGDVLIDDKLSNVVAWQRANPHGIGVVWDCPWNQSTEWQGMRTSNWETVATIVSNVRPVSRYDEDTALIERVLDLVFKDAGVNPAAFGGLHSCATRLLNEVRP